MEDERLIHDVAAPRWRLLGQKLPWLPIAVLLALSFLCFARLFMHPGWLLVDGANASVDHANRADPRPLGNDLTFVFLPHHIGIGKAIAAFGHLPFWDSRGFGGRPLVGNPQAGVFYPPVWAVWWGPPALLGWLTIGHLCWGGAGAYVLVRSAAQGRWAATVAGGVYMASPFLLAHTFEGHYPHVWAAAWYPWSFWAFGLARRGSVRGRLMLPVVLALAFLAGHPQEWLLLVLSLAIWGLADAWVIRRRRGFGTGAFRLLTLGGVAALSLGLSAIDLAPQLAARTWLLRDQDRALGAGVPRRYHLEALNAFQLLSPTALGGPADYFGTDNYWETVLSIGFVPLLLALLAVFQHPNRTLVRGWFVLVAAAFWWACGRHLLLFSATYFLVPGISSFRVPVRSLFLANLGAAVLAGLGVQTLCLDSPSRTHSDDSRSALGCVSRRFFCAFPGRAGALSGASDRKPSRPRRECWRTTVSG